MLLPFLFLNVMGLLALFLDARSKSPSAIRIIDYMVGLLSNWTHMTHTPFSKDHGHHHTCGRVGKIKVAKYRHTGTIFYTPY